MLENRLSTFVPNIAGELRCRDIGAVCLRAVNATLWQEHLTEPVVDRPVIVTAVAWAIERVRSASHEVVLDQLIGVCARITDNYRRWLVVLVEQPIVTNSNVRRVIRNLNVISVSGTYMCKVVYKRVFDINFACS